MSQPQLDRVRRLALALPEATERPSRGEPAFFVLKTVFVLFANNHPNTATYAYTSGSATGTVKLPPP